MRTLIILLLALSVVFCTSYTASAQSLQYADHVVINEIETNPPGDDSKQVAEWIELYNPTDQYVKIGQWHVVSESLKKLFTIPISTTIGPKQFLTYQYQSLWFSDYRESVSLRTQNGTVIDQTPVISDALDDRQSWQRIYDALDSDSIDDWSFEASSIGGSNGYVQTVLKDKPILVSVTSDKPSYVFDDNAILSGSVSEKVAAKRPLLTPEKVLIMISGPNYANTVSVYPNYNLKFSTSIELKRVLGISAGVYDVTVMYAGIKNTTQFHVTEEAAARIEVKAAGKLVITTDADSYIPGNTVMISASTTKEIPFEGLHFSVTDTNGDEISNGALFPSSDVNIRKILGGSQTSARFITNLFIDTTDPVYGTYRIVGQYDDQTAEHTFDVVSDIKENVPLSLGTDKAVYQPGDTIVISGRSNHQWVPSLSLEIIKSSNIALNQDSDGNRASFKILDAVRLEGDGTFSYTVDLSKTFDNFGQYIITLSGDIGTFTHTFVIVRDADSYVASDSVFSIATDKEIYNIGEAIKITGNIKDPVKRTSLETEFVTISIKGEDGRDLSILGLPKNAKRFDTGAIDVHLDFKALPDPFGTFKTNIDLSRALFERGAYTITAKYDNLRASQIIAVLDSSDIGNTDLITTLDKQIYGFGETLQLNGTFNAQTSSTQGVTIKLYKPDGDTNKYATILENGSFFWTWDTPKSKVASTVTNDRSISKTNVGTYRLNIETGSKSTDLFFKVSEDPANDSFSIKPITVSTSKPIYRQGDDLVVSGYVLDRPSGTEELHIPKLVNIKIFSDAFIDNLIYEANVRPSQGGFYSSTFELPLSIFTNGAYAIRAVYDSHWTNTQFSVSDGTATRGGAAKIIVNFGKTTFNPGETLRLNGNLNPVTYIESFNISLLKKSSSNITCGLVYCGVYVGSTTMIKPDSSAGFTYAYDIAPTNSVGSYEIIIDAGFDKKSVTFDVIEKPKIAKTRIIDKVNRIADSQISITPESKSAEDYDLIPRVISGTLLTPQRGQEADVNLRVVAPDGTCIIGQSDECQVSDSTRKPGSIYSEVSFSGKSYNVRYSGADAIFEKFSILPQAAGVALPTESFEVSIIKDDQLSRFYYKITYVPVENEN